MNYHMHPDSGLLWILRCGSYVECIPERKVIRILGAVQDNVGYWGHRGTHRKSYAVL